MRTYFVLGALLAMGALTAAANPTAPAPPRAPAAPATPAVVLEIGKAVPDFTLTDVNGVKHTLSKYTKDGNVVVLEWFNPGCPVVKKYRESSTYLNDTAAAFKGKKVVWLAIDSSAPGKEGGDPAEMKQFMKDNAMTVPVLVDAEGKVGHSYGAKCTPHMFVVSPKGTLVYMGAPDTSTPVQPTPGGDNLVQNAVEAALAGKAPAVTTSTPHGCSVKYAS